MNKKENTIINNLKTKIMNKKLLLFVICLMTISIASAQDEVPPLTSVALVGPGASGWPTDPQVDPVVLTSTDMVNWSATDVVLSAGAIKFRGNNSWALPYNWGGTTFLSGTAIADGDALTAEKGTYSVTFNSTTLAYTFVKTGEGVDEELDVVSVIGSATPGKWDTDTDMTSTDGVNYSINNIPLNTGALKFRGNHEWGDYNWGVLPEETDNLVGTATFDKGDISIFVDAEDTVTALYNITFNVNTLAYSISASLGTKGFNASSFKVYPNPSESNWNFSTANGTIDSIQVVDVLGKAVLTVSPKKNGATVDASSLIRGIYFARITIGKSISTVKLIKK